MTDPLQEYEYDLYDYDVLLLRVEHQDAEVERLRSENAKLRALLESCVDSAIGLIRAALANEETSK